jgi:hypothetical protein
MKKIFAFLFVGTIYIIPAISQFEIAELEVKHSSSNTPKVEVVGLGRVSAFPNAAKITLNLQFVKPTLKEAVTENQNTAKQVLAIIRKYVQDSNEIKVSLIATDKSMRWDDKLKKEVFRGFESSQIIIFTLNNLTEMQDFTEEILKTKIYEIERISYFHTNAANFIRQAQELAVADAIETSQRLANASKMKLGKVVYMETNSSPNHGANQYVSSNRFQAFNKGMAVAGVSSSGQIIDYTVTVNMSTQLE